MFNEVDNPMQMVTMLTRGIERVEKTLSSKSSLVVEPLREDI